ncbi:MAG TPA: polyprenyl synthetase family protein [Vicinamibacteria bacterium]|nr:polyprenyl synthetase family protein [Vicinamibacteria bacterium]
MSESPSALFASLEQTLQERHQGVETALREHAPRGESPEVLAAVDASLFAPSKRLRPILALLVADVLGGDARSVLPAACAIEMVHTASLILDDLPAMDDAKERRGRPACHVAFGEANAILAAFALLTRGFEVLASGWPGGPEALGRCEIAQDLARAVGPSGMIAGQARDLAVTDRTIDFATLEFIHSRKTGALFIAAAALGARAAGAAPWAQRAVASYAKNLGLAFQIVDDLIDATGAAAEAGKDVGQDLKKTTFVSFAGIAGARQLASELTGAAEEALKAFGPAAQPLRELARYVVARRR